MTINGESGGAGINVALLRGINVGGKNKLPMKELAALFVDAGCEEVRTYIQSGNVVFRTGSAVGEEISSIISASILDRFGYQVPVITRTARELQEIAEGQSVRGSRCGNGQTARHVFGGAARQRQR